MLSGAAGRARAWGRHCATTRMELRVHASFGTAFSLNACLHARAIGTKVAVVEVCCSSSYYTSSRHDALSSSLVAARDARVLVAAVQRGDGAVELRPPVPEHAPPVAPPRLFCSRQRSKVSQCTHQAELGTAQHATQPNAHPARARRQASRSNVCVTKPSTRAGLGCMLPPASSPGGAPTFNGASAAGRGSSQAGSHTSIQLQHVTARSTRYTPARPPRRAGPR
jgi:hypothetical protein